MQHLQVTYCRGGSNCHWPGPATADFLAVGCIRNHILPNYIVGKKLYVNYSMSKRIVFQKKKGRCNWITYYDECSMSRLYLYYTHSFFWWSLSNCLSKEKPAQNMLFRCCLCSWIFSSWNFLPITWVLNFMWLLLFWDHGNITSGYFELWS